MTKPVILAIEPDARQAGQLQAIARRVGADMQLVKSAERALATFDNRLPDLILTPALLSRRDEVALTDRLRALGEVGAHIQTLTIPILETSEAPARGGMLSALRREKPRAAGPAACEVDTFAEQVSIYLERAVTIRSVKELKASAAAETAFDAARAPEPQPEFEAVPVTDPEPALEASPQSEPESEFQPPEVLDPEPLHEVFASSAPQPEGDAIVASAPESSAPVAEAAPPAPLSASPEESAASADEEWMPYDEPAPIAESEYDPLAALSGEPVPVAATVDDVPVPSELSPAHAIVVRDAPAPALVPDAPAAPRQIERVRVEALPVPLAGLDGPEPDMLMTIRQLKSTLTAPRDTTAASSVPGADAGPRLQGLTVPDAPVVEHAPDPVDGGSDGLSAYFADAAAFAAEADVVEVTPVGPLDSLSGADALDVLAEFATEGDIPSLETTHGESEALPSILVSGPFDSTIAESDLPYLFASEEPPGEQPVEAVAAKETPRNAPLSIEAKTKPAPAAAPAAGKASRRKKKGTADEWRYFDPTQFRFAALIAKLDEITTEKR